jgi:hypothetical protein
MNKAAVIKHNLGHRLKKATLANDYKQVCVIAQEIFDEGLELEEIQLLPTMRKIVQAILINEKWAPSVKNQLDA